MTPDPTSSSSRSSESTDANAASSTIKTAPGTSNLEAQSQGGDLQTFERWRRSFSNLTGLGLSEEQQADAIALQERRRCEKWKNELVKYSQSSFIILCSFAYSHPVILLMGPLLPWHACCACAFLPVFYNSGHFLPIPGVGHIALFPCPCNTHRLRPGGNLHAGTN